MSSIPVRTLAKYSPVIFALHLFRRVGVVLVFSAMISPTIFVGPANKAEARDTAKEPISAQLSIPPEPYILPKSVAGSSMAVTLLSVSARAVEMLGALVSSNAIKPGNESENGIVPRNNSENRKSAKPELSEVLAPPPPPADVGFDFDGDGKADIGSWRPVGKHFVVKKSGGSTLSYTFGSTAAKIAPGDFDGDGKTDAGVFLNGTWTYVSSSGGTWHTCSLGTTGDIPVPGDYNGDGTTDFAIYRPSTGEWKIDAGCTGNPATVSFGASTDIPVPGDYDGDSKTDIAVWRPSDGTWYISKSSGGNLFLPWGMAGDVPIIGDFDGDGLNDPTMFRPYNGTWYVKESGGNYLTYQYETWGNFADQPVAADYDGDGTTDIAIWRPTTSEWWIMKSSDSTYYSEVLGTLGDTAIPSAFTRQVGGSVTPDERAAARLAPRNLTGGTDLYSQNFGWSRSLVSLPGRSGLDLDLGISYNSLIWTKIGSAMFFDVDNSTADLVPGFRLGPPVIEPTYFDPVKNVYSYVMVGASGSRTEFRQQAATNKYFSADSNYIQMIVEQRFPTDPPEQQSMSVTSTDGTAMFFEWKENAFRCTQIRDRNGNYITFTYSGRFLTTMTDTLGRVVTINYDAFIPVSITQSWKGANGAGSNATHTWATFSYTTKTVATNFSIDVVGPPNDSVVRVLDKITYSDGSFTKFEYNGYLQVQKVSNVAADSASHVLNYVSTNLDSILAAQDDCPRFTQTRTWAENSNGGQPVVANNTAPASDTFAGPNGNESTESVRIEVVNHPNDLYSLIHFAPSGYKEGLTLASEDCIGTDSECATRKRWTWTDWTQDNTSLAYRVNPRVIESRVGDGTNTKKTNITYHFQSGSGWSVHLPETVSVGDLTTILKTQKTVYNWSTSYTAQTRRIIGLPVETTLWEGTTSGTLMSKVTYAYDEGTLTGTDPVQNIAPTQHSTSSYGSSFNKRGNLTSVTRHDVTGATSAVSSSTKYNTAGSVVSKTDPVGRLVKLSYIDNFNSIGNPSTYAYPTTITDPNGQNSTAKYRYDIGSNVEATSPAPAGQSVGKTTKRLFDSFGRLEKDSVYVSTTEKSYTRYVYPTNGVQSQVYSTLVDVNTSGGPDSADEVYSENWFDGAGRVRRSRTEHPGSTGGWKGVQTEYDILGRVLRTSVPTEIDSSYNPEGDDQGRGWIWNYQEYDWMGRTTRTIPSDSSGTDGKDTLIEYAGCGCAGGLITTIQGPLVPRDDVANTNARRVTKAYDDILGRVWKSLDMNWDGTTPYLTTEKTLNGRDQNTSVTQTDGNSVVRTASLTYDGHGRLSTQHRPIEETGTSTTWTYNADDTVATVTDPRGAVVTYSYGNPGISEKRSLRLGIGYEPPSTQPSYTTISDTPDVSFSYDALGNRTAMTDGSGSTSYSYDSLSRLTSETKTITGLSGNFTVSYAYQLTGKLKNITDPFGAVVNYNDDQTARTTSITGSNFASVSTYASGIEYRAFGGIKEITYGSGDSSQISYDYDEALRVENYESTSSVMTGGYVRKASYEYFADGRTKKVSNLLDAGLDQNYKFDQMGRLTSSVSGEKLDNQEEMQKPFVQGIYYNAFGDMTGRTNVVWGAETDFGASYTNGRKTNGNEIYDEAGNLVDNSNTSNKYDRWKFDAAGRNVETVTRWWQAVPAPSLDSTQTIAKTHDGDGLDVKRVDTNDWFHTFPDNDSGTSSSTEYYIRSTVLNGQALTKLDGSGAKTVTLVYTGSSVLAEQRVINSTAGVYWRHADIVTGSYSKIDSNGQYGGHAEDSPTLVEYDPLGGSIPTTDPNWDHILAPLTQFKYGGDVNRAEYGCMIDGIMQNAPGACTQMLGKGIGYLNPTHEQPHAILSSLGFHIYWNPVSGRKPRGRPDGPDDGDTIRVSSEGDGGIWGVNTFGRINDEPPDCYTYYQLIYENEEVQKFINSAWERTVKSAEQVSRDRSTGGRWKDRHSGAEHGGIVTFDGKTNTIDLWAYKGSEPPVAGQAAGMNDKGKQVDAFMAQIKLGGGAGNLVLEIHTHPPNGPAMRAGPYANEQELQALLTWDPAAVTSTSRNPSTFDHLNLQARFGLVVYGHGPGNFTVYGRGNGDRETLKRTCVR